MDVARKIDFHKEETTGLVSKPVVRKENTVIYKKRRSFCAKISLCLICSVLALSMFFILNNYQRITELNLEINELNAIIVESEKNETALIGKLEEFKSERDIILEAKTKLGMTFPESNQVVYFQIKENNEQPVKDESNILSRMYSNLVGKAE